MEEILFYCLLAFVGSLFSYNLPLHHGVQVVFSMTRYRCKDLSPLSSVFLILVIDTCIFVVDGGCSDVEEG